MAYFPQTREECRKDIKIWQQILCDSKKARDDWKRLYRNLKGSGYLSLYEYQRDLALTSLERLRELRALMPQL